MKVRRLKRITWTRMRSAYPAWAWLYRWETDRDIAGLALALGGIEVLGWGVES